MNVINSFFVESRRTLFTKKSIFQKWIYHRNFSSAPSPLDGIKVIDLTRIVAGPYCTMALSDLGAEVYKVEQPGTGDEARKWGPPFVKDSKETCYFVSLNRNKKSICINLKSSDGVKIIKDLAKVSDVLIENYVPGKLDRLGIGYNDIKDIAPQLVYLSLTGYGSKGPYSKRPGYDVIAASVGGLLSITGPTDGDPCKVGVAMVDLATGLFAHGAIMAALIQRSKTGLGQKIDCDLFSTQVASLINIGSNYLNAGLKAKRWGTAHESIVPYEAFPTLDGYFTIGAGSNQLFRLLCEKLKVPNLAEDDRFSDNALRVKNRNELRNELKKQFKTKTTSEWMSVFESSGIPSGPVNTIEQVVHDPVRLKLRKPKSKKQVNWGEGTVDNEHMNKKKSKCCCIYNKPRAFGESSSDSSDDECDNCQGHVEQKKKKKVTQNSSPSVSEQPTGSNPISV